MFDQVYAANLGGPQKTTLTPALLVYLQAFTNSKAGLAAATAVVLFFIIILFTWMQRRVTGTLGGDMTRHRLGDPLSPSRAMQRAIYACLGFAALFYLIPFALAVSHQLQEPP